MKFSAWGVQNEILNSRARVVGAFAGKRGGKTEVGAIWSIMRQEENAGRMFGADKPIGVILAPTNDMLRRLSMKKFITYAKPFIKQYNQSTQEITWHDGSIIYGLSADKPERIEGIKVSNFAWVDEVFQIKEQLFLELKARVADCGAPILCTGSLGVQYLNPKLHWAHRWFKENKSDKVECYEWKTSDNPHFPAEELENLRDTLDPQTYRSMFEINWNTTPKNGVYEDFDDGNIIKGFEPLPSDRIYVSIDWGWAHPAAILFIAVRGDRVYVFDEIVESKLKLEHMPGRILSTLEKWGVERVMDYVADVAGRQEREQIGKSNIAWFKDKHGIDIRFVTAKKLTNILNGISLVRQYIRNGRGQRRLFVDERCQKTIDGLKRYRYPEKDGIILNENPIKEDDDAVDSLRYFFINVMRDDSNRVSRTIQL